MGKHEEYWNGLEQYQASAEFQKHQKDEFQEDLPIEETFSEEALGVQSNRRDFLKVFGFGLTAAALTACVDKPVRKAIPYVIKPETVTPGVANWYATTCHGCATGCGILVKAREGRPIKVEGNREHSLNKGGTCGIGQATVLSLYDSSRLKSPRGAEGKMSWEAVNEALGAKLRNSRKVAVVSNTITSPTGKKALAKFLSNFSDGRHIQYDAVSNYALAKVHSDNSGEMMVPGYQFDKADVIVSFDADFMGNWISGPEFTKGWSKGRHIDPDHPKMSKHIQFESRMSLTGSNADLRIPLKPSQMSAALVTLYNEVVGGGPSSGFEAPGNAIKRAAKELKKAKGKSLVVCGINDIAAQSVVRAINEALGNYGTTIDTDNPSYQAQGDDVAMMNFINSADSYDAVIFLDDANPVYDHPMGAALATKLGKVGTTVAFATHENETSKACKFALAQNHFMESWGDAQPRKKYLAIQQPLVRPLFDSQQWEETLLQWSGVNTPYYKYVQQNWEETAFAMMSHGLSFSAFWEESVRSGFAMVGGDMAVAMPVAHEGDHEDHGNDHEGEDHAEMDQEVVEEVAAPVAMDVNAQLSALAAQAKGGSGLELAIYSSVNMGTGRFSNNPWLQELPNPITKVTWDNYISVPYQMAMDKGWQDGDQLSLKVGTGSLTAPVIIQPGQANGTLAVSLGYGREKVAGKVGGGVGANAYPLIAQGQGALNFSPSGASVDVTGERISMAKTQTYIGYEMQDEGGDAKRAQVENRISDYILKETTLGEYEHNRAAGNKRPSGHHMISLWDIHDKKGHHWAMAIDLNKCTGCGSCIVSCNAENNIPVVGKHEVLVRREMHWMRIDRYFKGHPGAQDGSLQTTHQPLMCQHCDNAPCETVCPVLATVHSDEGLNQQVYNRCIGTRYCANNCPYKVRRFNWFSYYSNSDFKDVNFPQHDKIGRLVLNPDVTVRARGVMEKCSFCVQRIQEKKLKSKVEGRKLQDGEIQMACQQSCPADAIVFGDLNDQSSEIHKLYRFNMRGYHALEDVKTLPSVLYMTKVRNQDGSQAEAAQHEGEHA